MESSGSDQRQASVELSRRHFLQATGAAFAGAVLLNGISVESAFAQSAPHTVNPQAGMPPRSRLYTPGSLIRRVETDKPYISFTFDDGPWPVNTTAIMDHFADFGLEGKATFFQVGNNVENHLAIAKEVRDRGYTIGNHSMTHSFYKSRKIAKEIEPTQDLMQELLGIRPKFFRSPGLTQGIAIQRELKRLNMVNIFTDSDINDWSAPRISSKQIAANFDANKRYGQFVLLHDGGDHKKTVDAVPRMLEIALNAGYTVVSANTLLKSGVHRKY